MRRLVFVDMLRGVAILTVVVHHLPESFGLVFGRLQNLGGRGVDLFFVLSGFLIGTTCLRRAEGPASNLAKAKSYWLLRVSRIWPLYYGLMAAFVATPWFLSPEPGDIIRQLPWHYLLFFSNDVGQNTLELGVLWSLAIEEQFYLSVGILVLLCGGKRDTLVAAFVAIGLAALAVSLRFRTDLIHLNHELRPTTHTFELYFATLSRVDQLGFGVLAATIAPWLNAQRWANSPRLARASSWLGLGLVLVLMLYLPQHPRFEFTVMGLLLAVLVLWLQRPAIAALTFSAPERLLAGSLGYVGQLSFGFYLLHPITRRWFMTLWPEPSSKTAFLLGWVAVTVVLAGACFRWFETPILDWARARSDRWLNEAPTAPAA